MFPSDLDRSVDIDSLVDKDFSGDNDSLIYNGWQKRPVHNNSYVKWRAKVLTKIFILLLRSVTVDRNVFKNRHLP